MNKKGIGAEVLVISLIIVIIIIMGVGVYFYAVAQKEACKKIDMELDWMFDEYVCIDKNGKANFIKIDCDYLGTFIWDCQAQFIDVGDFRLK